MYKEIKIKLLNQVSSTKRVICLHTYCFGATLDSSFLFVSFTKMELAMATLVVYQRKLTCFLETSNNQQTNDKTYYRYH